MLVLVVLRADMVAMIVMVRLIGDSGLGCGESFRSVDNVMLRVGRFEKVADCRVGR